MYLHTCGVFCEMPDWKGDRLQELDHEAPCILGYVV